MSIDFGMKPKKIKGKANYYIDYSYVDKDGVRRVRRESLGTPELREAQRRAKIREREILEGKIAVIEDGITLKEMFDSYILSIHNKRDPKTIRNIENSIAYFYKVVGENTRLNRINEAHMDSLVAYRIKLKHKTGTINTDIRKIKTAFNFAVRRKLVKKNPFEFYEQITEKPKEVSILEKKHIELLRQNLPGRWLYLFEFYINTGARRNEVLAIEWKHIKDNTIEIYGKGNRKRIIPINSKLQSVIEEMGRGVGRLFKIDPAKVSRRFNKELKSIGVDGSVHELRRTYISHMLMAGVDPATVGDLTGRYKNTY
jgi:site-specific recombinase XerD